MSETELMRVRKRIMEFRKTHTTRDAYLRSLQKAGIVDDQGKLTAPYRPQSLRPKSK